MITSAPITNFNAHSLETSYAFLSECPDRFLPLLLRVPSGSLKERVDGLTQWRSALLNGDLPDARAWPNATIATPVIAALAKLSIVRFCRDQPELVDDLLETVLDSLARQSNVLAAAITRQLIALEELEREALAQAERTAAKRDRRAQRKVQLDEATLTRLRALAQQSAEKLQNEIDSELVATWQAHVRAWAEISQVLDDLGQLLGRGMDLTTGILKHTGWKDLLALRALLEKLPELRKLIETLGRVQTADDTVSVADTILAPIRRLEEELTEVQTPFVPAEVRGVERSGEIARMLPVEAAMLGHPVLKMLWHARRAERALLTYRIEGTEVERRLIERDATEERVEQRPRRIRGPIIVLIDTSGSMAGLPERIAKALTLETLRVAQAEQRRCFAYQFAGPGQILERELSLSSSGIKSVLEFLSKSFHDGSDPSAVLEVLSKRLLEPDWKKADVVIVSDGEWGLADVTTTTIKRARDVGTRFHGIQIGTLGTTGLHAICDPIHVFRDWAAVERRSIS